MTGALFIANLAYSLQHKRRVSVGTVLDVSAAMSSIMQSAAALPQLEQLIKVYLCDSRTERGLDTVQSSQIECRAARPHHW